MTFARKLAGVLKSLVISYIITLLLLFVIAVLLYKTGLSDMALGIMVVCVYIIATFVGGVLTGRKVRERRFAWGAVYGALYVMTAWIISAALGGYGDGLTLTCAARGAMCVAGGMLGAMLSRLLSR